MMEVNMTPLGSLEVCVDNSEDGFDFVYLTRADAAALAPILAHFAATGEVKGGGE